LKNQADRIHFTQQIITNEVNITPAMKYLKVVIPACLLQAGEGGR